ncbi:hypothetical protein BKI52_23945 [marine bacterium AO1-C]|nr:hypothetical protein BKI52_23945 [marine bacterium AO1-C]
MKSLQKFKKQVLNNTEQRYIKGGDSFQECGNMVYYHDNYRWQFSGCYRVILRNDGSAIYQGLTQHGIMTLHCPPKNQLTAPD